MPNRLRTSTLLLVAVGLLLGAPGPWARAQQPSADPPPDRPGAQPGADAPRTKPAPPAVSPKRSQGTPWGLKPPGGGQDRAVARSPARTERAQTLRGAPGGAARAGKNGFVLQLNLGTDFVSSAVGGSAMIYSYLYSGGPGLNGSFSFGYRSNRWVLSMGMDFRRFETASDGDKMAVSVVAFSPSVSYDLVSTYPMALFVTCGLPVGFMASTGDSGGYYYTSSSDGKDPVVGFVIGLGARYFIHPQFAIGMVGAFKGLWVFATSEDYYDDSEQVAIGNVAFSGSVFMMAIF